MLQEQIKEKFLPGALSPDLMYTPVLLYFSSLYDLVLFPRIFVDILSCLVALVKRDVSHDIECPYI